MTEPVQLRPGAQPPNKAGMDLPSPHNREAEEGLIGCVLQYPDKLAEVERILVAGARDFYGDRHQVIFAAIQALASEVVAIDPVTVANKLGGDFTATWSELLALAEIAPHPDAALDYAKIVADKARRRRDIDLARTLVHDAFLEPNEEAYAVTRMAFAEGVVFDRAGETVSRFRARSLSDLRGRERAPLLDPELRLRTDQLALIYARENVGKSAYVLLRMARLAAAGKHVFYVCGEGLSGILDRIDGIIAAHTLDPAEVERCFHIIEESPQFMAPAEVRELIMEAQALTEPIALIVFDTLATATEGQNENAPEVMSAVTGGMRRIMRALDCAGILIHHSGKDSTRGARGHSGLGGAVDLSIEVTSEEGSDLIKLHCQKARYDEKGWDVFYQLRPITLDAHADRTTVVAYPTDERPAPDLGSGSKLTRNDRRMLEILGSLACGMRYGAWVAQAWEVAQIPASTAKDSIRHLSAAKMVWKDASGMYTPSLVTEDDEI